MNAPARLALAFLLYLTAFQSSNADPGVPFTRAAAVRAFQQATVPGEEAFAGTWTLVGFVKRDESEGEYRANGVFTEDKKQYVNRQEIQFATDAFGFRAPGVTELVYAWPSGKLLHKLDVVWGILTPKGMSWAASLNSGGENIVTNCRILESKAMMLCRGYPEHDQKSDCYVAYLKLPVK